LHKDATGWSNFVLERPCLGWGATFHFLKDSLWAKISRPDLLGVEIKDGKDKTMALEIGHGYHVGATEMCGLGHKSQ
jgi:hypothetical protein